MRSRLRRGGSIAAALLLAGALLATVPSCGCSSCCNNCWGDVWLNNQTDVYPPEEFIVEFYIWPVANPYGPNWLAYDLPPGSSQYIGRFNQDVYDAEAYTDLVTEPVVWFDLWVADGLAIDLDVFN